MALTQHATHPTPSWDEAIVPVLRQRLEDESRLLTKRMSNISMSSLEEPAAASNTGLGGAVTATRPVGASSSRPNTSNSGRTPSDRPSQSTPKKNGRSRTLSQPLAFHKHSSSAHSANYRQPPGSEHRPTRIPKALRSPPLNPTRSPPMRTYSPAADLWEPPSHANSSLTSFRTPTHKFSNGLLNEEQPPFRAGSITSTGESFDPPRRSVDSEEAPFEHWYRGESSRNGGVGELRVGNRKEMLDIAQYGHALRNKLRRDESGYQDALTEAIYTDSPSRRRRADSVGPRGSFYLDEKSGSGPFVFDEAPLTDLELDDEGYGDDSDEQISRSPTPTKGLPFRPTFSSSPPPMAEPRTTSESVRTVTEAPPAPAPPVQPKPVPSQTKRAVSPQTRPSPTSPLPKKVNGKTSPAMTPMRERQLAREKERAKQRGKEKELQNRRSIGQYNIDGAEGDMMHAIPSWTQPVQRSGNWDEVVLPVVAKKKGLDADGSYETADGTAKPRAPPPIEPAPGTFGFDHGRYQSQREEEAPIPMHEFKPLTPPPPNEEAPTAELPMSTAIKRKSQPPPVQPTSPVRTAIKPPPSPAPFSHYAPTNSLVIEATSAPRSPRPPELEEEPSSGGCCKCVIM